MSVSPALLERLVWELRRAFRDVAESADLDLAPLGIRAADRALLEWITREKGPVSLSDLARRRSVSRQYVHQSLKRLPDPGWVEARPDPADRRSLLLSLTPKGRAFWRRVRAVDAAFFSRLAPAFETRDTEAALRALRQLRVALRPEGESDE
jgi:DNA-binding MarR family transcriptional regulator